MSPAELGNDRYFLTQACYRWDSSWTPPAQESRERLRYQCCSEYLISLITNYKYITRVCHKVLSKILNNIPNKLSVNICTSLELDHFDFITCWVLIKLINQAFIFQDGDVFFSSFFCFTLHSLGFFNKLPVLDLCLGWAPES